MKKIKAAGHAGDRLQQHLGWKLDAEVQRELLGRIRNCKWTPIDIHGSKLRVRMVDFRGHTIDVVFNCVTNKIITIIPKDPPVPMVVVVVEPPPPPPEPTKCEIEGHTMTEGVCEGCQQTEAALYPKHERQANRPKAKPTCKVCHGKPLVGWGCGGCEG